jgi:hypothetical protein
MALMRRSTEKQLKKIRNIVKNDGGDIADKISKDEKSFPNLYYMRNPSDIKIDTYEDNYSTGNIEKLKENKKQTKYMKNLRTFEQHDIYSTIIKMLDNNQITEKEAHEIVDGQKMPDIFKNNIKSEITKHCRKAKIESLEEGLSEFKTKAKNLGAIDFIKKEGEILHYENGQYLIELDEFVKLHDSDIQYKTIKNYKGYTIKINKNGVYLYSIFKDSKNLEDRISSIKKCEKIIDGMTKINEEAYYNFPQGVEQIPEFYLENWLEYYIKWCEENRLLPEYEDIDSLKGDESAISHVFYHAEIYCNQHDIFLDGKEFMDESYLNGGEVIDENFQIDEYKVKVKHDDGIITIRTTASSEDAAKEKIMAAENCPKSAILNVEKVSKITKIKEDANYFFSKGETIKIKNRDGEEEDVEVIDNFDSKENTHIELLKDDGSTLKITKEKLRHILINEDNNIDILRVGKGLDLGDIKGIINKIEGKYVFIEVGKELVKVPMVEVFKKYKKYNDRGLKISS